MYKFNVFLAFLLVITSSCTPGIQSFYAEPDLIDYKIDDQLYTNQEKDSFDISCAFVGDAINYVIFQIDINHLYEDPINFSASDVRIVDLTNAQVIQSISKEEALSSLEMERVELNNEKRSRTISNVAWVGVNVLAGLLGGGGSAAAVNSFAYSVESSVYILQERRDFDIINGSIEDEMKYINQWVLGEESVFPDESYTVDVLFPRLMDLRNIELQIDFAGKELYFPFKVSSIEIK